MNARRTGAVALKVLRGIRRDKRSLGLMLVAPMFAMAIFGFVFGTEISDVPVAVVNEDEGTLAEEVIANLDASVVRVERVANLSAAEAGVADGTYRAALHFPANFTEGTQPRGGSVPSPGPAGIPVGGEPGSAPQAPPGSTIGAHVDGSNSQVVAAVSRTLLEAVQATLQEKVGKAPIAVETTFAYAADAKFMDFFVPGIMAFAVLMFTTLLTLLAFVGERTTGTLARLLVTPVREAEIVLGYAIAFGVIGVVQALVLLGVALFVFDVLLVGSLALVVLTVALLAVDALSLGILLSAAARREAQAVQFFPLIVFPTFLLSGIFLPAESLPDWLAPLAWAIPPTYAVEALRAIMLRGWGLEHVGGHLLGLAGFAVAFLALAVVGLRAGRARPAR